MNSRRSIQTISRRSERSGGVQRITRIRPPESSAHTIAWTSVLDVAFGSEKARSSASDLVSASGAESGLCTIHVSRLSRRISSLKGGKRRCGEEIPRVLEIDGCPHAVPIKRGTGSPCGGVQLSPGSGEGQSHRETEVGRERGWPIKRTRCRALCPRTPRGARGTDREIVVGHLEADRPCRLELSAGLTLSPPVQALARNRSASKAWFRLSMK